LFGWFYKRRQRTHVSVPASDLRWRRAAPIVESTLPRFQNLGSDIGPLGAADTGDRTRVRNAFSPTRPINDVRLFAGRDEVMQSLIRSIEDMNLHLILYGERGIGKTSMLHILTHLARQARYQVVYHSCGEEQTFSDVFRGVAGEIPLLYDNRFGASAEETERGGALADLLPAGNFSPSQLTEAFSHLASTRVLILLDEFDRSPEGSFRRNVAELIKNLSDRSVRVQLVIAGVAGNLAELIEHIPSIRRNIYGVRVPEMTSGEIGQMISIGEGVSGLKFGTAAQDRVALIANGSPYLASLLAQYAGFNALDEGTIDVDERHVGFACGQVAEELRQRLSDKSIAATDRALAAGKGPVLLLLSGLAMRRMGRLDDSALRQHFGSPSFLDVAEDLRANYGLLTEEPLENDRRFTFVEEAVPIYLWTRLTSDDDSLARQLAAESA